MERTRAVVLLTTVVTIIIAVFTGCCCVAPIEHKGTVSEVVCTNDCCRVITTNGNRFTVDGAIIKGDEVCCRQGFPHCFICPVVEKDAQ